MSWICKRIREKHQLVIFITNRCIRVQGHYAKKGTSKYLDCTDSFRSALFVLTLKSSRHSLLIAQNLVCKLLGGLTYLSPCEVSQEHENKTEGLSMEEGSFALCIFFPVNEM